MKPYQMLIREPGTIITESVFYAEKITWQKKNKKMKHMDSIFGSILAHPVTKVIRIMRADFIKYFEKYLKK